MDVAGIFERHIYRVDRRGLCSRGTFQGAAVLVPLATHLKGKYT